eukprot:1171269-Rhodomonas_salina.1
MLNLVWTTRQVQPPAEDDASDTQETAPTATAAPSAPKFLNVSANPKQSRDRSREEGVRTASEGQRKSERETASEEHHMKRRVALTRVRDHRKRARMCREGRWFASSWSTLLPTSGPFRSSLPLQVSSLLLPRLPLLLLTTDLTTSTSSPSLPLPMASPLRPSSSVRRHRGCAQVDVAVSRRRGVCVQVRLGLRRTHRLWLHRSDHRLPSDGSEGNPSLSLYRLPCVLNTGFTVPSALSAYFSRSHLAPCEQERRSLRASSVSERLHPPIVLRVRYAMSGTHTVRYAMSGTHTICCTMSDTHTYGMPLQLLMSPSLRLCYPCPVLTPVCCYQANMLWRVNLRNKMAATAEE